MHIYIYNLYYSIFQLTRNCCFIPDTRDVTFWYQSLGCYSGDKNIEMCFKMVRTRQGVRTDPSPVWEVIRVFIMKVIQTGIPWQTPPVMYLQHQYSEKGELVRLRDDLVSRQAKVSMPEVLER
jgi:hypothetical protein